MKFPLKLLRENYNPDKIEIQSASCFELRQDARPTDGMLERKVRDLDGRGNLTPTGESMDFRYAAACVILG